MRRSTGLRSTAGCRAIRRSRRGSTACSSAMSVEEKVGQVIQADISSVTPEDVRKYQLGSILAGGNSAPHDDNKAPAADWLKQADAFWNASQARRLVGREDPADLRDRRGPRPRQHRRRDDLSAEHRARRDARSRADRRIGEVTAEEMARDRVRLGLLADARGGARRPLGPHLRRLFRGSRRSSASYAGQDGRGAAGPRRHRRISSARAT